MIRPEKTLFWFLTILLVFFLASTALAATENLTVASCSVVSGPLTIANCTGLNTSDDDTDVAIPKGKVLGTAMSDTSFNGTVNTVTVTFRHSGESGIGGTVGITFYDGTNGTTFCSEGTSTSNVSSFATSEVISCTPAGGWTAAKLDDLQIRVKNNDSGGGQDLFLSYLIVEVDYTAFVCGNNTKEGLEECDGTDLDSQTCATQGFDEGTLVCAGDCTFDTSGCSGFVCGNDTIEGSEVCDGTDLDSQTCVLQGFESGTLACQVDCTAFDTSSCTPFAETENMTVSACSSVSGTVTIANCDGLNTSDDDSDVILAKNAVLGAVLSDIIFDGSVDSVSVTFRHSGEAGIGGTVGITFYDGLNLAAFCSEDTSISNASSFTTSEVVSCTPVGGWDYAKLDNLQLRVQNKDTGSPDDAYLSYLMVAVEYTPTVSGGDGGTGGCGVGCCGGGTCDAETGEDYWTCRTDCSGPAVMVITLLSPMPEQEFGGGDTVLIQATVDADSQNQVAVKDFMIEGKFGLIELFDDGKHNDEMAGDRVYGNSFMVEDENTTIFQPLTLSATLGERTVVVQEGYQVVPVLALNIGSNKNTYSLGDLIQLNGLIKRQGVPLEQEIHLVLSGGGTILLEEFLTSDSQGAFSISYPTTTVDPEGEWTVFAEAMDEAGNYGFFEKTIRVFESQAFVELQIELLTGIDTFFERGETKKLLVRLLDQYGELVENARVEWVSPLGETFVFTAEKGQYALSYLFPHDLEAGVQLFQIRAQKETEYSTQQGLEEIELQISETPLIITVLEPVDFSVQVGEAIDFTIQVSYSSGALVEQASFSGSINGKPVFFSALEKGVYVASYAVQPEDQGRPSFSLIVTDEFQNQGIVELDFAVSGVSPLHFVRENAWLLAIVVGISAIMFLGGYHANFFRRKKDVLVKRKQVLESKIAENQKQYYKLNIITRATYTKLHSQYSLELERIAKELEKAEEEKK